MVHREIEPSELMRDVWILISLTCPVSIAGMHYPISLSEVLAANKSKGFPGSFWVANQILRDWRNRTPR